MAFDNKFSSHLAKFLLIDQQLVINHLLMHLIVSVWTFVKFYLNLKGLSNWKRHIQVGSVGVCLMELFSEDQVVAVLVSVMLDLPFCLNNA